MTECEDGYGVVELGYRCGCHCRGGGALAGWLGTDIVRCGRYGSSR